MISRVVGLEAQWTHNPVRYVLDQARLRPLDGRF